MGPARTYRDSVTGAAVRPHAPIAREAVSSRVRRLAAAMAVGLAAAAVAASPALAAPAGTVSGARPLGLQAGTTGPAQPVIVIVMENKRFRDIVGSPSAPYIQSMIFQGTLYTNYHAAPGSLPDYLAMTSGLTGSTAGSDNIFHQLQSLGVPWGEYESRMPRSCFTGSGTLPYKKGHNPAVYYKDVTGNASACANVLPYSSFDPGHLRAFSYVVPNMNNDMHTGGTRATQIHAGDTWLAANVPAMLNAGAEVILTWDEGTKKDERVATIAIGSGVPRGATDAGSYIHPGLLAGLEQAWGLPLLHAAQTATPLPIG